MVIFTQHKYDEKEFSSKTYFLDLLQLKFCNLFSPEYTACSLFHNQNPAEQRNIYQLGYVDSVLFALLTIFFNLYNHV